MDVLPASMIFSKLIVTMCKLSEYVLVDENCSNPTRKKEAENQFRKSDFYVSIGDHRAMEILHRFWSTLKYT